MKPKRFLNRKMKSGLQKSFIIFMSMLVILSGALPYTTPLVLAEGSGSQLPVVSKDVDGEESKEVIKGEAYPYHINVLFPEDVTDYESVAISDELDTRLEVQGTSVLIDGEVNEEYQAVVDGQHVSLSISAEQLSDLAGKEVKLQITTTIHEDAATEEQINNIAQILINGSITLETNPVVVKPIDEKEPVEPTTTQEETDESNDNDPVNDSSVASVNEVTPFAGFDINNIDSYGTSSGSTANVIYQFDGNDPTIVKGEIQVTGIPAFSGMNGLGVSEDGFLYTTAVSNGNYGLYKIDSAGQATFIADLGWNVYIAAMYGDKYYYTYYNAQNNPVLAYVDVQTKERGTTPLVNSTGEPLSSLSADLVFDSEGYVWVTQRDALVQINPNTSEILRLVPVPGLTNIEFGVRGLSFLTDGSILVSAGNAGVHPIFYRISSDGTLENLGRITNVSANAIGDLGSALTLYFDPNPPVLESEKNVEIFEKALGNTDVDNPEEGDILTYTIRTRNTVEEYSIVKGLVISDTIPEGLEYVSGTLMVDGELVTDEEDEDQGQVVGNEVRGELGDILDNNWHTIEFQVTVEPAQAGKKIENIATVEALNTEPDNPQAAVDIYPRQPVPDACAAPVALINGEFEEPEGPGTYDNSVAGGGYYYADTVPGWETTDVARTPRGIIQIMDPDRPSTIPSNTPNQENLTSRFAELNADTHSMLYQELPTVPGQTIYWRLDHRGYNGVDTMSVNIGPVTADPFNTTPEVERISTGTIWETYSGSYTVPAGQTVTRFGFKAISSSSGSVAFGNYIDNVFLGTEPCVIAEKTVSPEGEVFAGQELTYEVTIKNNGGDIAADVVFEDVIPEGTEYVPGSLKITDGPGAGDLTDEEGDDTGHFDGEKVIIELGDLPNINNLPDGVTVQFKVKALDTDTEREVTNKALIQYENLLTNESESTESNETTSTILPREEIDACAAPVALINGSFEEGPVQGTYNGTFMFREADVPGWLTTDEAQGEKLIEIWNYDLGYPPQAKNLPAPPDGIRYAELNAYENGMLYQDVQTTPGQTLYWRLSHMGRLGVDTMQLRIGEATNDPYDTKIIEQMTDDNTAWGTYTGTYLVPAGQTVTRFGFEAVSSAGGNIGAGNFLDDIFLGTEPCVVAEKTVSPEGEVLAGQELTYEVTVKNNGGDIAANTVFEDAIPEGTEYVPGSLKIVNGPGAGNLTDAIDDDAGHFDGNKVVVDLGDLPSTNNLPNGVTVQFKVKALVADDINEVANQAQLGYDNLLTNERKQTDSNEVKNPLAYQAPLLESEKTYDIAEKLEGNEDAEHPEVGDTLTYTIQTRNTIEDSLVKNLTILDNIPEGLEYVTGSLTVDGVAVTDEEDDDAGHSIDGDIFGLFGDVTDTEWHTVTFQVVVGEGQAGKDIENIATVDGDNINDPDKPSEEVLVYPRIPVLDSDKFSSIEEKGEGNTDTDKYQVGDTIKYTIQARNTVRESVVENFIISDVLPEGLTYVEGSLEVSHDGIGTMEDGTLAASFGDVTDIEWRIVTFLVTIDSGQSGQTIKNTATVDGDNIDDPDSPENEITVEPREPKLDSEKNASIAEKLEGNTDADNPEVGDILTYTIQTRNTVEDSLIENLTIRDVLPEGLEYVAGTLTVDGEVVTDEEDDDAGHSVDGEIFGAFGDITDTEWHSITFQVEVGPGQAGKDIENTATVDGDNIDDPDKPSEEVLVYPRIPVLDSDKFSSIEEKGEGNTDTEKYQVGDTIKYTIQARNTVRESVVENFIISDVLPEGLTYVEGSLEVSHDGIGAMEDGTLTASFGDVTDIEWRIVTFLATIDSGQSGQTIQNTATVDGDNIDDPDSPENEIIVDPREPKLESEKTSSIAEKLEGNTDADNPEVGDTLTYTIQTRNTVEDSLVENLTIHDVLPGGLEYVAESLTVDGVAVTDEEDGDAGHSVNGEIFGSFGDITDTEWHTVTFQVVVGEGQAGQDIKNIATVDGDNIDEPDEPSEEVLVYPREPKLDSDKISSIEEKGEGNTDTEKYQVGDTIKYTIQARNTVRESVVENFVISDVLPEGLTYVEGSLEASHEGTSNFTNGTITANFGDVTDDEWRIVTFLATIDSGQSGQTIQNTATVGGDNVDESDEPSEEVKVDPKEPKLESEKTASIAEKLESNTDADNPEVGDILTYTIQTRNTVEDSLVENLTIRDVLPEGLEYVGGTLTVDGVSVTDEEGDDAGHSVNGEIFGSFGDITDTEWHSVTFQVVVGEGQAGKDIENIATVDGDNVDEPDEPSEEVLVYPRNPKLESDKFSSIEEKGEGNTDTEKYQVGDTIKYTIQARNMVRESVVENFVISDVLPEGLTYVEGSLEVSHDGTGTMEDGTITATFGDVTDVEWRIVTFLATIESGQSGQTINNTATVDGDNIDDPDSPENEIIVDPREPKLESKKTSSIAEKLEGNTDADNPEVGDILMYTIQTRNTVEDSLVKNLTIRDVLPEGLEYVEGTLTVDGVSVTDEEDDDAGHSVGEEIFGAFGDVADTEWHSVTFQVVVGEGQAGKNIENIATVDGDNVDDPDKPSEEVLVYPREPKVESEKTSSIVEKGKGNTDTEKYQVGDTIEYTIQARNTVKESLIENFVISDVLPEGLSYVEGSLEVSHEGIGNYKDGTITANFGDVTDTEWRTVTFLAIIDVGQSSQTIQNTATVDGDNIDDLDRPSEEIFVHPREAKVESEKTAKNVEEGKEVYEVGDTVVYTIRARNTEKDSLVENLVISDVLPEGLTYVEDTLEVSHEGTATMEAGTLTASFGNVSDTEWRTVTFHVTVDADQFGNTIKNVATVEADNMEEQEKPTEEIVIEKEKATPPVQVDDNEQPKQPEATKPVQSVNEGKELPKTATNHYNLMLTGFVLLLVGTIIWYWRRRRENA